MPYRAEDIEVAKFDTPQIKRCFNAFLICLLPAFHPFGLRNEQRGKNTIIVFKMQVENKNRKKVKPLELVILQLTEQKSSNWQGKQSPTDGMKMLQLTE